MIIRVDKCHSFGLKKSGTSSKQFQPKLFVNNELIPAVKQDEYFTYFDRHFDYKMSNNQHKEDPLKNTKDMMERIDDLPIHPKNKLLIYDRYVLSKLSWNLTIADIDMSWVKQSLDGIVNQYVRGWLEIPIAGTLDIIQLSKGKFGICYIMISTRFAQCQTVIRNNLRKSTNSDVVELYHDTNCDTNLQYDQFKSTKEVINQYRKSKEERLTNVLTTQSLVIKSIWEHGMKSAAVVWSKSITKLPKNIYNFSIRYNNNTLENATNMHKWGKTASPLCLHCNKNQTLGHVIGGCKIALREKRYKTNMKINSRRKESNYRALMDRLSGLYNKVQFTICPLEL